MNEKGKLEIKAESYGRLIEMLFCQEFINEDDLMPILKKGTCKMFKEDEDKIFIN